MIEDVHGRILSELGRDQRGRDSQELAEGLGVSIDSVHSSCSYLVSCGKVRQQPVQSPAYYWSTFREPEFADHEAHHTAQGFALVTPIEEV